MTFLRLWWPYQETPAQPEGGRYRKVHVIETEVQKDEQDDEGKKAKSLIVRTCTVFQSFYHNICRPTLNVHL